MVTEPPAAPQIGVSLRVFTYHLDDEQYGHLVNPIVRHIGDEEMDGDEGCLSLPGLWYPLRRAAFAAVEGLDPTGVPIRVEGDGLMARCLQHECDHLDGKLFVDRLDKETRRAALRAMREL